ncbi:MAG: iron ABC transporter substrate-binding protein [Firmicutes bacterium]|nr:iron ABC transporter substrate-binding protein [Bacillota bacterium]
MQKKHSWLVLGIAVLFVLTIFLGGCGEETASIVEEGADVEEVADAFQVTDLSGRTVEFSKPAEKVVAIGPGALRFVCYITADKVIGIEELEKNSPTGRPYYTANISKLEGLPTIGQGGPQTQPDAEKLVSLGPDVIFSCLTDQAQSDELQAKTGIPVVVLDYGTASTFSKEVYDSLHLVGKVIGEEKRAQEVVDYLESCKKDLNDRTVDIPEEDKPSVYVGGLGMQGVHGIESTAGEFPPFEAINAKNVVDETGKSGSMMIDKEKIVSWDPDILFMDSSGYELFKDDYQKNPAYYRSLSAVKNGQVYSMIPYNWYWTNIEIAVADAYYAGKVIYPEQFKDIDPIEKADELYKFMVGKELYAEIAKDFIGFEQLSME